MVEYYKQAIRSLESSNSKDHGEKILDIVGNKQIKVWQTFLEFKVRKNSFKGCSMEFEGAP